jgi:hydroxypyruvate isomerase
VSTAPLFIAERSLMTRYLANCSMLFTELPLLRRPAAARSAGFEAIEFWWPFATPVPGDAEVEEFVSAVDGAGVRLAGLNFFGGDLAGPDCGVLSVPGRASEFRDNLDVAVGIGERLGVGVFNALYGPRLEDTQLQDETAAESLALATEAAGRIGATVLIEPLSGPKPYPLRTADQAVAVVDAVVAATGATNIGFLCDMYHLASNGEDLDSVIARHAPKIRHVQIADVPGRGEPGSGGLDLAGHLATLRHHGYDGWVALEYRPTTTTGESLAWLRRGDLEERR